MKIQDAKQMYSTQLNTLWDKKRSLTRLLKEDEKSGGLMLASQDRVEISRELEKVDAQYSATEKVMADIMTTETAVHNSEAAKQQSDALAKAAEDMTKMMEIFRRISSGAEVPSKDENKLMEYDFKLYLAAKTAALTARENDEEYDSLWEDEEENTGEQAAPSEIAGNTEIAVPAPETVTAEAGVS